MTKLADFTPRFQDGQAISASSWMDVYDASFSVTGEADASFNGESTADSIIHVYGSSVILFAGSYRRKSMTAPSFLGGPVAVPVGASEKQAVNRKDVENDFVGKDSPKLEDGSNKAMGVATLVGGTVTVNNTKVTANSRIFLTSQADGGTPGTLRVSARVAGTSFTITSSSGTDTSTVAFLILEPDA